MDANKIIAFWLNEAARAAWFCSRWMDEMAEAFSEEANPVNKDGRPLYRD